MKKTIYLPLILFFLVSLFGCKNETKKSNKSKEPLSFNYTSTKPTNGKLKASIEMGSTGFNYFIIEVDENKNWELKEREYGSSLISEGMTTTDQVNSKLKDYIKNLENKGILPQDIHFVVSSGAFKDDLTQLIVKELKTIGRDVFVVSPEEEASFGVRAYLPKEFIENSFVVDLGSANTKISYLDSGKVIAKESYGSKYYQRGDDDKVVFEHVKKSASTLPLEKTKTCFMLGGAPYLIATTVMKGEETYVPLSTNAADLEEAVLKIGKKAESGLNIYKAIMEATACEQVIFINDGNFTVGYLLELPY